MSAHRRRLGLGALLLALSPMAVQAQTTVLDFTFSPVPANYAPIDPNYGTTAYLTVVNQLVSGFGSGTVAAGCSALEYWHSNYSNLTGVAFPCVSSSSVIMQFAFQPTSGNEVRLDSFTLGSDYAGPDGVGPARGYEVRVYDWDWNPIALWTSTGSVSSALTLLPGVTSSAGLYLQIKGADWDVGVDNITA